MEKRTRGAIFEVAEHPVAFGLAFFAFFTVMFLFLSSVGAIPDPVSSDPNAIPQASSQAATSSNPEAPLRVVATSIGLNVTVSNPTSTDVTVLDDDLKLGAVHYPGTAELGVDGTVLIFGHSSYLPIVLNQHYKTFDGVQNLKAGDIVSVYSGTTEYRYSVVGVKVADATSDVVQLPSEGRHLVLVTCDSFATTSNRFVLTADFVGAYALANSASQ